MDYKPTRSHLWTFTNSSDIEAASNFAISISSSTTFRRCSTLRTLIFYSSPIFFFFWRFSSFKFSSWIFFSTTFALASNTSFIKFCVSISFLSLPNYQELLNLEHVLLPMGSLTCSDPFCWSKNAMLFDFSWMILSIYLIPSSLLLNSQFLSSTLEISLYS